MTGWRGGMGRVDGLLQEIPQHVLAVDLVVGQLAADHLQLALELGRLERHVLHRVGHQLDGRHGVLGGAIDEEDVMSFEVKALVAPPKVSTIFSISFSLRCDGGAAGDDVFQHVAQAGPQVLALEGAAGVLDEAAHRGHRRRVVLLDDHRQAVGERGQGDLVGQVLHARVTKRLGLWRALSLAGAGVRAKRAMPGANNPKAREFS